MILKHIPLAVKALYEGIASLVRLDLLLSEILEEHDITEHVLRVRFARTYNCTPEEVVAQQNDNVETWLATYRADQTSYHPDRFKYFGRRFFIPSTYKDGSIEKSWQRFLINNGLMITCVDEVTKTVSEVWGREQIDDVARQIGWQRWADWPKAGPRSSLLYADLKMLEENSKKTSL